MSQEQEQRSFTIFLVYFVLVTLLSFLALTAGRAFEDSSIFNKILFYVGFGLVFFLWIGYDIFVLRGEKQVFTFLHNPDSSLMNFFGKFRWRWFNNPLRLLFLSVIILYPVYLLSAISAKKTFFVAFAQYQIAETASIWAAMEPAAFVETLILVVVGGFGVWLVKEFFLKKSVVLYFLGLFGVCVGVGFLMYAYHSYRYGGQEFELLSVVIFFALSMLLILLTGSIIPALVAHLLNNGFGEAFRLFGSDSIIIVGFIIYFFLLLLFVVWVFQSQKKVSVADKFWSR